MDKIIEDIVNKISSQKQYNVNLKINDLKLKSGVLRINGYKHSMVQLIALSVAYNFKLKILNAPSLIDTYVFCKIIKRIGGNAFFKKSCLYIDPTNINISIIPSDLSNLIHGSMYLLPALVIRFGEAMFSGAGGCKTNGEEHRPFNHIISVMNKFGISSTVKSNEIFSRRIEHVECPSIDIMEYSDNDEFLSGPLVGGATKVALLLSFMQDKIEILNPYLKTDVKDLLLFFSSIGKNVIIEQDKIIISNEPYFSKKYVKFKLTQCVSEVVTYICFSVLCNKKITFKNLDKERIVYGLSTEFELLKKMNIDLFWGKNNLVCNPSNKIIGQIIDVNPKTIQSDHQPFFALMLINAKDSSKIIEKVWQKRFMYVNNLRLLGANIHNYKNSIIINNSYLKENNITLPGMDVRTAGVSLIAAIASKSKLVISDSIHLFRGYDSLLSNMSKLGVNLKIEECL